MTAIVDNTKRRVGDFLRERIEAGSDLSIVSAYFTIYAYDALRETLESAGRTRFLHGEPGAVGVLDPGGDDAKAFRLDRDGGIELKRALAQKPLARACAAWIENQVEIRTIDRANFLHGKLYHVARDGGASALVGSSNFTLRGLGFGAAPNVELNVEVRDADDRQALLRWFDDLWRDESLTRDAKPDVLAALERLGRPYAPEFVYYKTLFHVFESWLARHGEREGLLHDVHLYDTEIWKALYAFQRDGATSAVNRLLRHNGCIVADSVGLGKTWTALAVIKFFELRNERVLVLCPKRLEDNWVRYTAWAGLRNNPFEKDRLNYTVELPRFRGHLSCWEEEVSAMPKSRPPYAAEFRRQMVELVRSGRTPEALAREFEPSAQAIRNWVAQAGRDAGERTDGLRTGEREEMRRLRRENRRLREEREILAKATAWFARETGSGGSTGS